MGIQKQKQEGYTKLKQKKQTKQKHIFAAYLELFSSLPMNLIKHFTIPVWGSGRSCQSVEWWQVVHWVPCTHIHSQRIQCTGGWPTHQVLSPSRTAADSPIQTHENPWCCNKWWEIWHFCSHVSKKIPFFYCVSTDLQWCKHVSEWSEDNENPTCHVRSHQWCLWHVHQWWGLCCTWNDHFLTVGIAPRVGTGRKLTVTSCL